MHRIKLIFDPKVIERSQLSEMAVPTKDSVIPNDAPEALCLDKHIDFIAKYGQVSKLISSGSFLRHKNKQ